MALAVGRHEHALTVVDREIEVMETIGILPLQPDLLYLKSRVLSELGRDDEAYAVLLAARDLADHFNSRRSRWAILAALGEYEASRGNAAEAENLRARAREGAQFIADHIERPELRAAFLGQSHVQQILSHRQAP